MLTRAISPRRLVRVADVDAYGTAANSYTGQAQTSGPEPAAPWAVYLTDSDGQFRLLAFDFDTSRGDAAADAATFCGWLTAAGLAFVQTQSGPTGGRHVWLALCDPVGVSTTASLARLVRAELPSLDLSPLTNPITGCVRPPGAPHRDGGASIVLAGDADCLASPTVTAAQVDELVAALSVRHLPNDGQSGGSPPSFVRTTVACDDMGRLYLPGPTRPLAAASAVALAQNLSDTADRDASRLLRSVLIGAAAARWRCSDVAVLLEHAPGLEHLRTRRHSLEERRPRTASGCAAMLARQWDRAVRWVAAHPRQAGAEHDPTFSTRAAALVEVVEHTQVRADAAVGRWARPGGPADRRVLDALCAYALHALTAAVEADVRRLALTCGIGRETARVALLRLCGDGWIAQVGATQGARAATWTLPKTSSTPVSSLTRSQVDPRPPVPCSGAADRAHWLTVLRRRLQASAHDVFTFGGGALGHVAGQVYASLCESATSTFVLARRLGYQVNELRKRLSALQTLGLIRLSGQCWTSSEEHVRDSAATRVEVVGRLVGRANRYAVEREAWAWWSDELAWRRASGGQARRKHRRVVGPEQEAIVLDGASFTVRQRLGRHPVNSSGRADYAAALARVTSMRLRAVERAA